MLRPLPFTEAGRLLLLAAVVTRPRGRVHFAGGGRLRIVFAAVVRRPSAFFVLRPLPFFAGTGLLLILLAAFFALVLRPQALQLVAEAGRLLAAVVRGHVAPSAFFVLGQSVSAFFLLSSPQGQRTAQALHGLWTWVP